ncbi:MAG: chorismate lyase [Pseudomonadota bacterium]
MLTQATRDNSQWQATAPVTGDFADWLVSERLMTPDIRRSFEAPVRIEVLAEGATALPDEVAALVAGNDAAAGWLREIVMYSGDTLLVHALCYAPERTLAAHPWLMDLGANPLGGQLAQRNDVARVAQHYSRSDALTAGDARVGAGGWSRRSLFDIGGAPLVLFEHLSAGFVGVPRQTEDDAS